MGIVRLSQYLSKRFPHLFKRKTHEALANKSYAVDASSTMYSFLVKTISFSKNYSIAVTAPTDSSGNQTGHLIGLMNRALLCRQLNMKTIWVFDGKPPVQKSDELYRRRAIKQQASEKIQAAQELGDLEQVQKQSKMNIYISKSERQDAKKLLQLIGLQVIQAKSQAQSQCAWLAKKKIVEAVIGQDIDTIVFGAPKLIRNFKGNQQAIQLDLSEILKALQLTYEEFLEFCILCGCDYTSKIVKIGPVNALKLLKTHKNIDSILIQIQKSQILRPRHVIPDDFNHLIAKRLFESPQIIQGTPLLLEPTSLKEQQLRSFLLQKEFDAKRVESWIKKYKSCDAI